MSSSFQSTPPSRVATGRNAFCFYRRPISIHTTLAGGDQRNHDGEIQGQHFNPHHPRGWRLIDILAHTPHLDFNPHHPRGWRPRFVIPPKFYYTDFNPHHPRGWRRCSEWRGNDDIRISIHTTLAGGDYAETAGDAQESTISIHTTLAGGDLSACS